MSMEANRRLRAEIVGVLRSTSVSAIDFTIGTVRVTGNAIRGIADAVEGRVVRGVRLTPIHVVIDPVGCRNQGYDGVYHTTDYFSFRFDHLASDHDEALVVHEAVHANFDLHRTTLPAVDDEAAAYLSQCIYYLSKGNAMPALTSQGAIFQAAWPLAQQMRHGMDHLTNTALAPLRQALRSAPNYTNLRRPGFSYTRNGIPGI